MKRIAFFSIITLVLMGCGGGSGTSVDTVEKINADENTSLSLDQNVSTSLDSTDETDDTDIDTSVSTHPYPAPLLSDEEKEIFLQVINAARAEGQDCGQIDSSGIPVTDSDGNYIYDGSNIMSPTTALTWNDALYAAAYEHSNDLAQSDTASHSGSGTASDWTGMDMGGVQSTFVDRARNNGYTFSRLGENISMGTYRDTIQEAVDSWLASPGHCVNLMNPLYTEVGVGYVEREGTLYRNYWTQVLGTPSN